MKRETMKRTMELMEARRAQRHHWVQNGDGKVVFRGNERQCQSHYRKNGGLRAGLSLMSQTRNAGEPPTPEPSGGGEAEAPAESFEPRRLMGIVEQFEEELFRAQMDEALGRKKLNMKAKWEKEMTDPKVIKMQQHDPHIAKMFGNED